MMAKIEDPWMLKIMKYLYGKGAAHTAQVARGVHIATTTANKYLNKMMDDGFVIMNKLGVGKPVYWTLRTTEKLVKIIEGTKE